MYRTEAPISLPRKRLLVAIVSLALGLSCGKKASNKATDPKASEGPARIQLTAAAVASAGIEVELVASKVLDEVLAVSGTLSYDENKVAHVGPRIGGRVVRILADFGQAVRPGQALAEIDSPEMGEALAQWRKSRSVYSVRQQDVERAKRLLDGKAISQGEFLSRDGEFRVAKAELDNADSRLHLLGLSHEDFARLTVAGEVRSQFPLTSPIAGKVIDRKINPGEVVEAGKPLFTVGDIRTLWLLIQLYEKDLARVRAGQEVEILTETFKTETFRGRLDYVGDQVEAATRTVRARSVIANSLEKLKPGMFVEARLSVVGGPAVTTVPTAAIQEVDKMPTVFVEVSSNVFESRRVETGRSGKSQTEVKSGVRPGERVATKGSFALKAEMKKSDLAGD